MGFHNVGKENGMSISKTKTDILRITGSMRDAEENTASVEEKPKQAINHFEIENKKLELVLIIFPYKALLHK